MAEEGGVGASAPPVEGARKRGRPPKHGLYSRKKSLTQLVTRQLDGRSKVAVAVRAFKEDISRDLGGDLTRAQQTILEDAARKWVILCSLDDWIGRQPTLVTRKRRVLDVVMQRVVIADGLARNLERLGLQRKPAPIPTLAGVPRSEGGGAARLSARARGIVVRVLGDEPEAESPPASAEGSAAQVAAAKVIDAPQA